jgi:peroxiredoxin
MVISARARTWVRVLSVAAVAAAGLTVAASVGPKALATGERAGGFSLPALVNSRHPVSLRDYAGRPVIINFCASWSPPCTAQTLLLSAFYRVYHGHVLIIGVDARDERSTALGLLHRSLVTYPVAADPTLAVASRYHVPGLPATYFLDARHKIIETELGWLSWRKLRQGVAAMNSGRMVYHPGRRG